MVERITEAMVERMLRKVFAITAEGSSQSATSYGPPYGPPYFIIDTSTAEPEVNWPGELIEQVDDVGQVGERLHAARIAVAAAALATETGEAKGWQPTHRHKKRGTTYRLDGYGELQTGAPIGDYAKVAIYRAEDGTTWVRPVSEFNDGRFEALPAAPTSEGSHHG